MEGCCPEEPNSELDMVAGEGSEWVFAVGAFRSDSALGRVPFGDM